MKVMQWLATMALVVAGVMLLVKPLTAHAQEAKFVPTRFTVVDEGTVGMPHVTLVKVSPSRHFIMYDQPAKFDAALQTFLQ